MIRNIFLCPFIGMIFLWLSTIFSAQAQYWEFGGSIGITGYMGDINPHNPLQFTDIAYGGFIKKNFNGYWSAKLNYFYGQARAQDSQSSNEQFRQRNLSFFSSINELGLIGEFNFFNYAPKVGNNKYTPFILTGIALLNFNPKTTYRGNIYELQPLKTEGQKNPYSKSALSIPFGAGFKYHVFAGWNLITEIGYRITFTDYLDDVSGLYPYPSDLSSNTLSKALSDRSGERINPATGRPTDRWIGTPGSQRGSSKKRDNYMFFGLTLSYAFLNDDCPSF